MKTEEEVREHRISCYKELERIEKQTSAGTGAWRTMKRYIDALDWVLEEP